jgi:hypothetical protein
MLICFSGTAAGQLVSVDGGQGITGEPSGGTVGLNFGNWTVQGSLGAYNGSTVGGGSLTGQLSSHWNMQAGDQMISVGLPNVAEYSTQVLGCGGAFSYSPSSSLHIGLFGGMGGGGYSATNLQYFTPQIALGALSVDYYPDRRQRVLLFSRMLFSNRQTALAGLWFQSKRLKTGFAAGTGSNQPHVEGLFRYTAKQWDIREAYIYSHQAFQLLTLPQFQIAQEDRENIDAKWRPLQNALFLAGRHEYLDPAAHTTSGSSSPGGIPFLRGSMDTVGTSLAVGRQSFGANLFESRFGGSYGSGASFLASQKLSKNFFVDGNYYLPLHTTNPMPMLVVMAGEKLNRRLTLNEFATHSNGQWSVNYGGGLHWDWIDMNVGYATTFIPLAQSGGRFEQSMNVDGHINIGRWQFGVNTYVQPNGAVLHAYEVRTFYLHSLSHSKVTAPVSKSALNLPDFLISGSVKLEGSGAPVADVPLRVEGMTIYSDEIGTFNVRVPRRRATSIGLILDRPIDRHVYEQVSGPPEVMPGPDVAPGQANFVVRIRDGSGAAKQSPYGPSD